MDRAGGYLAYRALCEDALAYEDVLLVMSAEAEAAKIARMKAEAHG